MKDPEMLSLLADNVVKCKRLSVVRRNNPIRRDYIRGDHARKHVNALNRRLFLYRFFETRFEIKRGDVFTAYFEYQCGCEIDGPHFVVALQSSSQLNQIVTVVPLSSFKKDRELNPASEIYIGKIPGVANGKETIAIINQIKSIDKGRLFDKAPVENFNNYAQTRPVGENGEISLQNKYIYRLTDEQFFKIQNAIIDYIKSGYIRHDEE